MKKCKQVHFIKGTDLSNLENKLNEALMDGAELGGIDIASLTGAIVVTEFIGEIKKTALDELEDKLGRHNCEECPFFTESTDKRKKWHTCEKGKRVQKSTPCCIAYYDLIREEAESDLSENQGEDERVRLEGRGCSGMAESITSSRIRQIEWEKQIPTLGMRIPFGIPKDSTGGTIQGGTRCLTRSF